MNDRSLVELHAAARMPAVSGTEQVGRWKLKNFTVTKLEHERQVLEAKLATTSEERAEMEISRLVPPGDYVTLQRRMTDGERRAVLEDHFGMSVEAHAQQWGLTTDEVMAVLPDERAWMPVMSDTPAEIVEHHDALVYATGRVLITGLGLGCLPRALLTLENVTHIDIIEIDPEVIELMSPFLEDERVVIHQGDARDPLRFFPEGTEFDYAWHDIWTQISADNLTDSTAEHGLSFGTMMRTYRMAFKVWRQECWSRDHAERMHAIQEQEREAEQQFHVALRAATVEERVDMVMTKIAQSKLGLATGPLEPIIEMMDPEGRMREHIREQVKDPDFIDKFKAHVAAQPEPVGERPNAHLEEA